jgi:hypothetical protein
MYNFLQDAPPTLRSSTTPLTQSFGLQRPWEEPVVQPVIVPPVVVKKQNNIVRRGNRLFILKNI